MKMCFQGIYWSLYLQCYIFVLPQRKVRIRRMKLFWCLFLVMDRALVPRQSIIFVRQESQNLSAHSVSNNCPCMHPSTCATMCKTYIMRFPFSCQVCTAYVKISQARQPCRRVPISPWSVTLLYVRLIDGAARQKVPVGPCGSCGTDILPDRHRQT